MEIYIYILQHPITKEIRYVGKTNNPKMRFQNHVNIRHNEHSHKRNWINSILQQKLKPEMIIIDVVNENDWRFWERYWILQFRIWGCNLINHSAGGNGLSLGNQTSYKKGQKPWNWGTAKIKILQGNRGKTPNNIKNQFRKGDIPWNKNKINYKLTGKKTSIPILQIDIITGEILNEFVGCREAALFIGCTPENIRRVCVNKSKSAKKYKWQYKK